MYHPGPPSALTSWPIPHKQGPVWRLAAVPKSIPSQRFALALYLPNGTLLPTRALWAVRGWRGGLRPDAAWRARVRAPVAGVGARGARRRRQRLRRRARRRPRGQLRGRLRFPEPGEPWDGYGIVQFTDRDWPNKHPDLWRCRAYMFATEDRIMMSRTGWPGGSCAAQAVANRSGRNGRAKSSSGWWDGSKRPPGTDHLRLRSQMTRPPRLRRRPALTPPVAHPSQA